MASFVIVTEDGSYPEGEEMSFPELNVGRVHLESYRHEGDYVVLHFAGGVEMAIPESRVQRIVTRGQVAS
ncbi:hypothetical protein ACFWMG_04900 [Streptomyces sp. NPDC127074]|uniref:hypothetical protein n=1 Tax=Streptomyces sp. NPDC127074 TaxID=3347130 RepID=UPI0036591405